MVVDLQYVAGGSPELGITDTVVELTQQGQYHDQFPRDAKNS
jgi:hypothetical protein